MSTMALVIALAAQATAPSGPPAPATDTSTASTGPQVGTLTFVDLDAGVGYSTNPVQRNSGSSGAGYGRFSVRGVHTRVSTRTTTSISAFAQEAVYSRRNGGQLSADLRASHTARVSERFSVYGSAQGSFDKGGQLDTRVLASPGVPIVPGDIQPPVILPGGDILSLSGRQYRLMASVGGSYVLSARDSMNFSSGIQHVVSKNGSFDTRYTTIPLSIGYDRTLSVRTAVGVQAVYQHTDYNGPSSFESFSPRLTLRQALSERMNLSASLGPSFSSSSNGSTTRHSTGIAGDLNICSATGERSSFCGTLGISQQAATSVGATKSITAGLSYSRRLDANQTLRLAVDANRYSRPTLLVTGPSFSHATYVRAAADYSRRIDGGRWFGGATLAARKFTQTGPDPKMDFSGSLFIRYRLGDIK